MALSGWQQNQILNEPFAVASAGSVGSAVNGSACAGCAVLPWPGESKACSPEPARQGCSALMRGCTWGSAGQVAHAPCGISCLWASGCPNI